MNEFSTIFALEFVYKSLRLVYAIAQFYDDPEREKKSEIGEKFVEKAK